MCFRQFDEFITWEINRMEEIIMLSKGTLDMIFLHILHKVSKKDDKVDLNESSTKYTKTYLNSIILPFQS